ncbi:MAG: peroxiredoxin family protein [Fimbriimonas sp.]
MKWIGRSWVVAALGLGWGVGAVAQSSRPAKLVPAPAPPVARQEEAPGIPAGIKAPDFAAYTADGKKVSLSDFKGKVVILDFWAVWCGPCMASMPGLEKIYQQIKGKDVVVLSLNTWDDKGDFQKFVKENSGTTYHFNFARDPAEGDRAGIRKASIAKRLYKVPGIPMMYVIDRKGNIVGSVLGSGNEEGLVKLLGKVGVKATVPAETE